jgi:hypothetical protein
MKNFNRINLYTTKKTVTVTVTVGVKEDKFIFSNINDAFSYIAKKRVDITDSTIFRNLKHMQIVFVKNNYSIVLYFVNGGKKSYKLPTLIDVRLFLQDADGSAFSPIAMTKMEQLDLDCERIVKAISESKNKKLLTTTLQKKLKMTARRIYVVVNVCLYTVFLIEIVDKKKVYISLSK